MVHHWLSAYNRIVPPFIAALRAKDRTPPEEKITPASPPSVADDIPPAWNNLCESGGHSEDLGPDSESHSGGSFGPGSGQSTSMEVIESALTIRLITLWPTGKAPKFPVGAIDSDAVTRLFLARWSSPRLICVHFLPLSLSTHFSLS